MTPTANRIIAYLEKQPGTRVQIAEACCTTKTSVHKIVSAMMK